MYINRPRECCENGSSREWMSEWTQPTQSNLMEFWVRSLDDFLCFLSNFHIISNFLAKICRQKPILNRLIVEKTTFLTLCGWIPRISASDYVIPSYFLVLFLLCVSVVHKNYNELAVGLNANKWCVAFESNSIGCRRVFSDQFVAQIKCHLTHALANQLPTKSFFSWFDEFSSA